MSRPCEPWTAACVDAAEGNPPEDLVRHMSQCPACREAVEELREGIALVDPGPAPVPGPWLAGAIRRAAEKKKARLPHKLVVLAPMAAAAGLLVFLSVLGQRTAERDGSPMGQTPELVEGPAFTVEDDSSAEASLADLAWEEDWGVGLEGLLARADAGDLERLVENLEPNSD